MTARREETDNCAWSLKGEICRHVNTHTHTHTHTHIYIYIYIYAHGYFPSTFSQRLQNGEVTRHLSKLFPKASYSCVETHTELFIECYRGHYCIDCMYITLWHISLSYHSVLVTIYTEHRYIHTYIHTYTHTNTNTAIERSHSKDMHTNVHIFTYMHIKYPYIHSSTYTSNSPTHIHLPARQIPVHTSTYMHIKYPYTHSPTCTLNTRTHTTVLTAYLSWGFGNSVAQEGLKPNSDTEGFPFVTRILTAECQHSACLTSISSCLFTSCPYKSHAS